MGRALQRNVSDPSRSSEMEPKDGSKNEAQKRLKTAAAVLKATSKYVDEMTPSANRARMLHYTRNQSSKTAAGQTMPTITHQLVLTRDQHGAAELKQERRK